MKKLVLISGLLIALAVSAVNSFAQTPPTAPPRPPQMGASNPAPAQSPAPCILTSLRILQPRMLSLLESRLKLTDDQKTKVNDYLTKSEEAMKPLIEAQRKSAETFVNALAATGTTEDALISAADSATKAEAAVLAARIKTLGGLRALLTNEQNQELNNILIQHTSPWRPKPSQPTPPPPPVADEPDDVK